MPPIVRLGVMSYGRDRAPRLLTQSGTLTIASYPYAEHSAQAEIPVQEHELIEGHAETEKAR